MKQMRCDSFYPIVFSDNEENGFFVVVISPMDLIHLFHWPRLLQLNVHQFVRMLVCLSLLALCRSCVLSFFFRVPIQAFFPPRIRSICAAMRLQFFQRARKLYGCFGYFLFLFLSLWSGTGYMFPMFVTICTCIWRNCSRLHPHQMSVWFVCLCVECVFGCALRCRFGSSRFYLLWK